VGHPHLLAVPDRGRPIGIPEAENVRRQHVIAFGKNRQGEAPIRPGRDARTRTVNEDQRLAAAGLVVVRLVPAGFDEVAGFERDRLRVYRRVLRKISIFCRNTVFSR
jgi:hypothetical protein